MKNCTYCGRENKDDALQCCECGTAEFVVSVPPDPPPESLARTGSMTVHIDITQEDRAASVRFMVKKASGVRLAGMIMGSVVGLVLGLMFCFIKHDLRIFICTFTAGYFCALFTIMIIARISKRHLQPASGSCFLGARQVSIENDGCRETSQDYDCLYRWSAIRSVDVTDQHVFVMIDRIVGIIVPRKAFSSNTQRLQFVNEIQQRLAGVPK